MGFKQVILLRTDLKLPKGKACVQCAHASVEAVLRSNNRAIEDWRREGMKKVVLKVKSLQELVKYCKLAKREQLVSVLITDAGRTFFKRATKTCVGIGPAEEGKIDKITGQLKIF